MEDDLLIFNGIRGETGEAGMPPMSCGELVRLILRTPDPSNLGDLRQRRRQDAQSHEAMERLQQLLEETERKLRQAPMEPTDAATVRELSESLRRLEQEMRARQHLGVREGVDASRLEQAGWGAIFAEDAEPELLDALRPLIDLRREQAGGRFRLYSGRSGYRCDGRESKSRFLVRSGATAAGPVSPEAVPYYLLIVGSPEKIPFEFQHQLDVQYAVGRVHFDTPAEYRRYAESVVAAERQPPSLPRRFTLFGVANPDDRATDLSSRQLVTPLAELFQGSEAGWDVRRIEPDAARKDRLLRLLGRETPALLFTASHGMEFAAGSPQQRPHQGAILCQDWPGRAGGPVSREHYLSGADVTDDASVHGLFAFLFACYSAGTPARDSFQRSAEPRPRAPTPLVSALPQRLLAHPAGGALAVIGHIDRAWSYSFHWPGSAPRVHTAAIESVLRRILRGERIGYAMEYINQRYAELATVLCDELDAVRNMRQPDERALAELFTATHDARGYCVLGDPAVRLQLAPQAATGEEGAHADPDRR